MISVSPARKRSQSIVEARAHNLFFFGTQVRGSQVNMSVRKKKRPNPTVAGRLANLIKQSRPQCIVVDVIMRMRGNLIQKQAALCSELLRNCDLETLET